MNASTSHENTGQLSDTEEMDDDDSDEPIIVRRRRRKRRRLTTQSGESSRLANSDESETEVDSDSVDILNNRSRRNIRNSSSSSSSTELDTAVDDNQRTLRRRTSHNSIIIEESNSSSSSTSMEVETAVDGAQRTSHRLSLRRRHARPIYEESTQGTNGSSVLYSDVDVFSDIEEYNQILVSNPPGNLYDGNDSEYTLVDSPVDNVVVHSDSSLSPNEEPDAPPQVVQDQPPVVVLTSNPEAASASNVEEIVSVPGSSTAVASRSETSFSGGDEGQTCPICFDTWSNAGEHRIVALKCGHLFGKMCIEKWLKGHGSKCPQCNAKIAKKDMIFIYAANIKVEDTSERERLNQEIEKLKKLRNQEEKEKAQLLMKMAVDSQHMKQLQKEIQQLKYAKLSTNINAASAQGDPSVHSLKLCPFQAFDLSKDGNCRVMAVNTWMNLLVISLPSHLNMFPGFGIKKVNTLSFKVEKYIPLHSKQIRDIDFNPNKRDLLLSVSLDKIAKVTNMCSDSTVISYTTNFPLWCCCWNSDNSSEFFVGTSSGLIIQFDTVSNTEEPVRTYQINGSGPIVSLTYVPYNNNKSFSNAGLIVTRLTTIAFLEILNGELKDHALPLEGPFSHTSFDPVSRHFLTTCRPTDRNFHARHILCELKVVNLSDDPTTVTNVVTANQIHCFEGSTTMKVLSRNALCSDPEDEKRCLVVFSEESTNSIKIFDVSTSSLLQTIKLNMNVVDILPFKSSQGNYVAFLAEKSIKLYKWI